jgi:hypothetical protein
MDMGQSQSERNLVESLAGSLGLTCKLQGKTAVVLILLVLIKVELYLYRPGQAFRAAGVCSSQPF